MALVSFCGNQVGILSQGIAFNVVCDLEQKQVVIGLPYMYVYYSMKWIFDLFTGVKRIVNLIGQNGTQICRAHRGRYIGIDVVLEPNVMLPGLAHLTVDNGVYHIIARFAHGQFFIVSSQKGVNILSDFRSALLP